MKESTRSLLVAVLIVAAVSGASQWWYGLRERRLGQEIAQIAAPGDIRLLSSLTCEYCDAARHWLRENRVAFDECFIEQDAQCRAHFDALLATGTPTLLVKGQPQVGFDPKRVLERLKA